MGNSVTIETGLGGRPEVSLVAEALDLGIDLEEGVP
jgi:hypothetical protein